MPNWCHNYISITGEQELISNLWDKIQKTEEFLNVLFPRPKDQEENWYRWNCDNWGTKWDLDESSLKRLTYDGEGEISGYVGTAWSPPLKAFDNFLSLHEDDDSVEAECRYWEPGYCIAGIYGNTDVDHICYCNMSEEQMRDNSIIDEVLEAFPEFEEYVFDETSEEE